MKSYFKKNKYEIIITFLMGIFVLFSHIYDYKIGIDSARNFSDSIIEMISFLPLIFILIGLFDVWIPRGVIEKHLGENSGMMSIVWMVLLAMLQAGPLYGAFPVAYMLWKKGTSVRNIFIYIGAFTTMKLPMLSFEIGFLGLKFSLLRTILSMPVFIIIAVIMQKKFGKSFSMNDGKNN
ncbi:MAG TPA: permease [Spirochaetota bacterium]|nr:permease [Spirochaetota bacterium]HQO22107.1 permease [Spirochaetota bacterium]HQQ23664.1 permease [Spirochaetota bacterium]